MARSWKRFGGVVAVANCLVASELVFSPAVLAESVPVASVGSKGPELSVVEGRAADPSLLPGVGSPAVIGERPVAGAGVSEGLAGLPDPTGPMPSGWRSPFVKGFVEGSSVEVEALTTETRKVFDNPDGTSTAEVSASPVRFKDASGRWTALDMKLKPGAGSAKAGFVPESAPVGFSVGGSADSASVVASPLPVGVVALSQPRAGAVDGVVSSDGSTVTFPNAVGVMLI